jgi:hypothetical protein
VKLFWHIPVYYSCIYRESLRKYTAWCANDFTAHAYHCLGVFWLTKVEFFEYFPTLYLSASNMTAFKED